MITPAHAAKLGLIIYHTNVEAQKIDDFIFQIFGMVLTSFQVEDKLN